MTTKVTHELRKGGGWVLIGTQEASNDASLTQTGLDSTYDAYCIILSAIVPVTDDKSLNVRIGDSSGIDSGASDYQIRYDHFQEGNTNYEGNDYTSLTSYVRTGFSLGTGTGESASVIIWLLDPGDSSIRNTWHGIMVGYAANAELRGSFHMGQREAVITLDRIQILMYSGNIASGRMTVWGMKHT